MKMKLPFLQLEKEFVQIVSPEDLKKIVGGTYGGPTASWDTTSGLLENLTGMISAGLFDYTGSGNSFEGTYDLSALNGSGSVPFSLFTFTGSIGSIPPTPSFTFGSIGQSGVWLGSAIGSTPGAFHVSAGSFDGALKAPGLNPSVDLSFGNKKFTFTITGSSFGVKLAW